MSWPELQEPLAHLPDYLSSHFLLTVAALTVGAAISLPLAALVIQVRRLAGPVLAVASVVQTIPGLALLALMVPLLGRIGVIPALLALILYSVLPILRNTVTGALGVDRDVIEAARGIGMTDGQILRQVRFPLAAPVIVAGLRTATVWTVGTATLSTPVGATSLGNYIFSGLQTQNMSAVLLGCAAAAALAISLDGLIRLAETAARRRDPRRALFVGAVLLTALGFAVRVQIGPARAGESSVVLGAKTFTEQYILSRLMSNRLEAAGQRVEVRDSLGSTVVFNALASGEIDAYVDYAGTIWANHMKRTNAPGRTRVLSELASWLDQTHGILLLGPLGFENAYALAMRADRADALGIRSLEDLAPRTPELKVGGDYEFFARPEWRAVRDRYGFRFARQRTFDSTLMYRAVVSGHVDVISAFSSDGRIEAFDLRVLSDPLGVFPPYDAVLLLSPEARKREALLEALRPLVDGIDDDAMRRANKMVDVDKRTIGQAAVALDDEIRSAADDDPT